MPAAIHLYRPQRSAAEDLEAILVAREPLIQSILEPLQRWKTGMSRQHHLFIGPRGMGKTFLLKVLQNRIVTNAELNQKWRPVVLAEESYAITSVSDLIIEALRILADETGEENLNAVYRQVKYDDNDARAIDLSLDAFRRFHQTSNRAIVLMVENLNRLLERQVKRKNDIHTLRRILIEEEWLVLFATSPTYLNAVTEPDEPFFEFFQVHFLAELNPEEQRTMFQKLVELNGNVAAKEYLDQHGSRLRALYHFTGGNPRLTVMLYDLVANQSITNVKNELDLLLDQITPFYQDRMKEIGEQEAKLLETMALLPEGHTPTELAKEARMPAKNVRALLTRLERAGYVRREPRRKKRTIYMIPERMFRIWHQMNHSRAEKGKVLYLLEFFRCWYATREERDEIWNNTIPEIVDSYVGKVKVGEMVNLSKNVERKLDFLDYILMIADSHENFMRTLAFLQNREEVKLLLSYIRETDKFKEETNSNETKEFIDITYTACQLNLLADFKDLFEKYKIEKNEKSFKLALENQFLSQLFLQVLFLLTPHLDYIPKFLEFYKEENPNFKEWGLPYLNALKFLQSNRDPIILNDMYPELKESVQCLVKIYDKNISSLNYRISSNYYKDIKSE
ncbi:MAG: hypothetical protein C4527_28955 [Candidatus Omnitrophota bacterium]|jgi:DNA-binding transcriptional ArsR family regulator|nr:MAG: hypothetical protein C4527_28955 [Candidatus Omnitrophota bacterium]